MDGTAIQVSPSSLHQKVKDDLLARIQSGQLPPGAAMPTEAALCREYGVSRITVRRAMAELVTRRLVTRRRGVGSFVTGRFVPRLRAEWRHEFRNGGVQALDYADLGGFTYAIRGDDWTRDNVSVELGTDYVFDNGWRIGLGLSGSLGQSSRYATETITIRKQF